MKNNLIKIALLAILTTTVNTGCSKFEDGPSFSLRTKKQRLTGDWKMESVTVDGKDMTAEYLASMGDNSVYTISKDGKYHITGKHEDHGTWQLGEDKDDIFTMSEAPGAISEVHRILRLTNKELWLRDTDVKGYYIISKYKQ